MFCLSLQPCGLGTDVSSMCDAGAVEFRYRTEVDDDEGAIKYMFEHMEKMRKHMRGKATDLPWEYVNCFFKQCFYLSEFLHSLKGFYLSEFLHSLKKALLESTDTQYVEDCPMTPVVAEQFSMEKCLPHSSQSRLCMRAPCAGGCRQGWHPYTSPPAPPRWYRRSQDAAAVVSFVRGGRSGSAGSRHGRSRDRRLGCDCSVLFVVPAFAFPICIYDTLSSLLFLIYAL